MDQAKSATEEYVRITNLPINQKRVLIRCDLNVPIIDQTITSEARIMAALPTIRYALSHNAAIILMSHLGQPKNGPEEKYSLKLVATALEKHLEQPVSLIKDWQSGIEVAPGEIVLCENIRYEQGETNNDPLLANTLAQLCDIFVMDAFATIHREHASTCGIAQVSPQSCIGLLVAKEIEAILAFKQAKQKPVVAIVAGAKVSTKLALLKALIPIVDRLITGGGIANTLLKAKGHDVGISLVEEGMLAEASTLLELATQHKTELPLPEDIVSSTHFEGKPETYLVDDLPHNQAIFDIGPKTISHYQTIIESAQSLLWNGPVGVFETPAFSNGTRAVAEAITRSHGFSLAGGGDTIAALKQFGLEEGISYISTGGGALLAFLTNEELPGLRYIQTSARESHS